jgi:hypothetical protein
MGADAPMPHGKLEPTPFGCGSGASTGPRWAVRLIQNFRTFGGQGGLPPWVASPSLGREGVTLLITTEGFPDTIKRGFPQSHFFTQIMKTGNHFVLEKSFFS